MIPETQFFAANKLHVRYNNNYYYYLVEGSTSDPTASGAVFAVGVVGTAWSCKNYDIFYLLEQTCAHSSAFHKLTNFLDETTR